METPENKKKEIQVQYSRLEERHAVEKLQSDRLRTILLQESPELTQMICQGMKDADDQEEKMIQLQMDNSELKKNGFKLFSLAKKSAKVLKETKIENKKLTDEVHELRCIKIAYEQLIEEQFKIIQRYDTLENQINNFHSRTTQNRY
jgi:hypothetical protein